MIGDVLSITERRRPGKKRDRKGMLVTEILLKVDVIYKSSERMTLNEAQEAAQMASMKDRGDGDDSHSVRSAV